MRFDDRQRLVNGEQTRMDLGGKQTAGEVLDRIRRESRDESEKGRWFEQLFMRLALQEPEDLRLRPTVVGPSPCCYIALDHTATPWPTAGTDT